MGGKGTCRRASQLQLHCPPPQHTNSDRLSAGAGMEKAVIRRTPCMPCPERGTFQHQRKGSPRGAVGSCWCHSDPVLPAYHLAQLCGPIPRLRLLPQEPSWASAVPEVDSYKGQRSRFQASCRPTSSCLVCRGGHSREAETHRALGVFQRRGHGFLGRPFRHGHGGSPSSGQYGPCSGQLAGSLCMQHSHPPATASRKHKTKAMM